MKNFFWLFFLFPISAFCQPQIIWERTFGGTDEEQAYDMCLTIDKGVVVTGEVYSDDGQVTNHFTGSLDVWVIRIDSMGNLVWQTDIGGSMLDDANSIAPTSDGGFLMLGLTSSNDGNVSVSYGQLGDLWLVKLNSAGSIEWEKSLGGYDRDWPGNAFETHDGNIIVFGATDSNDSLVTGNHGQTDLIVYKLDSAGNVIWQRCFGGTYTEYCGRGIENSDHDFVFTGWTNSLGSVPGFHGAMDCWLIKVDQSGNLINQLCLGGMYGEKGIDLKQTTDKGYIITADAVFDDGMVNGNHGDGDFWQVKLDNLWNLEWQKCNGGSGAEETFDIELRGNSFVSVGYTLSNNGDVSGNHGGDDGWLYEMDSLGNLVWQKCLGGSQTEFMRSVVVADSNTYYVAGLTTSNDGDVSYCRGFTDFWVVKLANNTTGIGNLSTDKNKVVAYNSMDEVLTIRLPKRDAGTFRMYDISGRLVATQKFQAGETQLFLNLNAGWYTYVIETGEDFFNGKLYSNGK